MTKKLFITTLVSLVVLLLGIVYILNKNKDIKPNVEQSQVEKTQIEKVDTTTASSLTFIVNKKHPLPENYEPKDLVRVPVKTNGTPWMMRKEASDQLVKLFKAAEKDGIQLRLGSGYRSYSYQKQLYNAYVQRKGKAASDTFSARAGHSEHQTGLAADILGADTRYDFTQNFESQKEAIWLKKHAHEYGFVLRFIKGKEEITGYMFEPWHFRYLGIEVAKKVQQAGTDITLEEYFKVEGGSYPN
ncbi:M15 family metallopeptidase [Bulleidia sp. zg-1006]|uniref:M15 family metallopeptidase n=1 Tax=Bulleidia sp. zg-1006 TaxID=2806552 RepID=UPI0019399F1B|nr:M15 family metallopeptidase [Bulleidia sp. zg-1006]QRG86725.1 M15 family metallopeptidase [Bulleidia sp. zg-1006]